MLWSSSLFPLCSISTLRRLQSAMNVLLCRLLFWEPGCISTMFHSCVALFLLGWFYWAFLKPTTFNCLCVALLHDCIFCIMSANAPSYSMCSIRENHIMRLATELPGENKGVKRHRVTIPLNDRIETTKALDWLPRVKARRLYWRKWIELVVSKQFSLGALCAPFVIFVLPK